MNMENLEFSYEKGVLISKILGDIDHHSAKFVRGKIDSYIFGCKPALVLLDLSAVEFMDSSGLGLILGRFNTSCEIGAEFRILSPSRSVKKILELAGIERLIKIEGELRI